MVKQGPRTGMKSLGLLMWLVVKEMEKHDQVHISEPLNLLSLVLSLVNGVTEVHLL